MQTILLLYLHFRSFTVFFVCNYLVLVGGFVSVLPGIGSVVASAMAHPLITCAKMPRSEARTLTLRQHGFLLWCRKSKIDIFAAVTYATYRTEQSVIRSFCKGI